jgi:hypothetical protein
VSLLTQYYREALLHDGHDEAVRVIDVLERRQATESAVIASQLRLLEACQLKLAEAERQLVRLTEAAQVGLAAERRRDRD